MSEAMSHYLTLGYAWVPDDDAELVFAFVEGARRICEPIDGFFSTTLWMDLDFPEKYAVMAHFGSLEAAVAAQEEMSASTLMTDTLERLQTPPDIRRIEAGRRHGTTLGRMELGQLASVSIRRADPGQGGSLEQDLSDVFEGLKYLDGYLGSIIGPNVAIPDEIVGFVLWTDRKPFDDSVARGSFYEIRLFERIA